jgi:hypothetical protein
LREGVRVLLQVDLVAGDCNALGTQAKTLFEAAIASEPYLSTRSDHTMPGDAFSRP